MKDFLRLNQIFKNTEMFEALEMCYASQIFKKFRIVEQF